MLIRGSRRNPFSDLGVEDRLLQNSDLTVEFGEHLETLLTVISA